MATPAPPGGCWAACSARPMVELSINAQTQMFLATLLLGAALGAVYDLFRISRLAFRPGWLLVLLEDLAFFLLAALLLFGYFMQFSAGQVRFFALAGAILGWLLYYFTLGALVIRVSRQIIAFLQRFFGLLGRMIAIPLTWLLGFVKKCGQKLAKPLVSQKNRLKSLSHMLYNKHVFKTARDKPKGGNVPWRKSNAKKKKRTPPWTPFSKS